MKLSAVRGGFSRQLGRAETFLRLDCQHAMYTRLLTKKGIKRMIPLLKGNYMGIYNVLTSLLGADVPKEEVQRLLDRINRASVL